MTPSLSTLAHDLDRALALDAPADTSSGGFIATGFDAAVDEYRALKNHGKEFLAQLQQTEIAKTGISSLKIKFNNVFGYFFEVPKGQAKNAPDYFIRKQTVVNAERFITPELKEYEEKVLSAEEKLIVREQQLFGEICAQVLTHTEQIQQVAAAVAELDLIFSFAQTAQKRRYSRPRFSQNGAVHIRKGRHPVIEALQVQHNAEPFIPNDLELGGNGKEPTLALITGPNMAGKSTFLRQNALIILLAHLGSFVPAEAAEIPLTDRIFTRIGSGDMLSKGQSTFLVEMQEAAAILHNATTHSFVILDEIGRGTSTFDGLSLAWAIAEHLEKKGIKTLFATHYHELIALMDELPRGQNFSVAVLENENGVTFLHRIVPGGASKSFGIEVAELAGLPESVTRRAKEVLGKLEEKGSGKGKKERREEKGVGEQQGLF